MSPLSSLLRCSMLFFLLISSIHAIRCYICNSDYNVKCWSDYEQFLQGCSTKSIAGKRLPAIGCRVIHQYVNEEHSIVRECAYSGEDVVNKATKGSFQLTRVYSQCSKTHGCNGAASSSFSGLAAIGALALAGLAVGAR